MRSEQVAALNKIVAMIDEKASQYKSEYMGLSQAKRFANRKLILDLVDDAGKIAGAMQPVPQELMSDLRRLADQLNRMG